MTYKVEIFYGVKVGEKKFEASNKTKLLKRLKKTYAVGCTFNITKKD